MATALLFQAPPKVESGEASTYTHPFARTGKRMFDLLVVIAAAPIALLLSPIIALAIKLESPGPVIYRQERLGISGDQHGHRFDMLKFRSMRTDAEKSTGAVWAKEKDPRVTRVGWFLRKTRLDEVPQLVNVLKGDMSIVGPRPERPSIADDLSAKIPFYEERVASVKPGITGLAQIYQGYDRDLDDVRQKILYDFSYSLVLKRPLAWLVEDLRIILATAKVMLCGRGQ